MPTLRSLDLVTRVDLALIQDTAQSGGRGSPNAISPASDGENYTTTGGATWGMTGSPTRVQASTDIGASYATLGSTTFGDIDLLVRFQVSASTTTAGVAFHFTDTNNHYRARYGSGNFVLAMTNAGVGTTLATTTFTISTSNNYFIRVRAVGSTLFGKIWQDGTTEPTSFQLVVKDTTFTSGNVALFANLSAGNQTAKFDRFVATNAYPTQRDLSARMRLASPSQFKDVAARVRLLALSSRDLLARMRLLALSSRDLPTRVRLLSTRVRDIAGRFPLQALSSRDLSARLSLLILLSRDLSGRMRLLALSLSNLAGRMRLLSLLREDLSGRMRLLARSVPDLAGRMRLLGVHVLNLPGRLRLLVLVSRDLCTRVSLLAQTRKDWRGRLWLVGGTHRDLFVRLPLFGGRVLDYAFRLTLLQGASTLLFPARCVLVGQTSLGVPCRFVLSPFYPQGIILIPGNSPAPRF